jgi:hypothetical protein
MTSRRATALLSLAAYLVLFGVLARPWWSAATDAVTLANDPRDARLIIWILGWVAHALAHAPARLFDAPIFHPAPGQLAGSEHLLSAQLAFAPVYAATGNAVLAANVAALLCLPAAAFAMERLLAAQGLGGAAAWFGGLVFAIGLTLVPPSLQSLQHVVVFLPLVALRLQRLREQPRARETGILALVVAAGMFSSYYMAVLVVVTAAAWGAFELWRCERHRGRFAAGAAAAVSVAGLALVAISGPYLRRPSGTSATLTPLAGMDAFWARAGWLALGVEARDPVSLGLVALAIGGAAASLRSRARERGLGVTALVFVALGGVLVAFGWPEVLDRWLGFFRTRTRYLLLSTFGLSVLVAVAVDRLRSLLPWRGGGMALLAVCAGTLVAGRLDLVAKRSDMVLAARDREHYRQLRLLAEEHGPGPVLEMPYVATALRDGSPEAMVGQLEHGLPLVTGFTGYPPDHAAFLRHLLIALPAPAALETLIDATHLRWILVRPAEEWPDPGARARFLDGVRGSAALGPSWTIGPWTVLRLDWTPQHPAWFEALAAGPQPGRSVLGVPMAPLSDAEARAIVSARRTSGLPHAGRRIEVEAVVHNRGPVAWPAWTAGGWDRPGLVRWEAHWRRRDDVFAPWTLARTWPLRHDVAADEVLAQSLSLPAPAQPGLWDLRITVRQRDGAAFSGPGNAQTLLRLDVAP